ncbi:sugar-binding domain-containing protein [soil metagenome]
MGAPMGPAESVLAATVARRHFLLGEPKIEIAERLGINRFKVARLLEAARECGMVKIEITSPGQVDLDLSARLKDALGLVHCAVVLGHDTADMADLGSRGAVAAELLAETLRDGDILGLPWSRSVLEMTTHLTSLPRVQVIQLSGAMEMPGFDASSVDIVRATARVGDGEAVIFHAPFILDDPEVAHSIRRQPSVAEGLTAATTATHAVVGIGAWAADSSTLYALATSSEREEAAQAGVIGETAGVFFDEGGNTIPMSLTDRMITVSGAQLRAIPEVIAIAGGAGKAEVMLAAARGGLINGVVLDTALADAILRVVDSTASEPDVSAAT